MLSSVHQAQIGNLLVLLHQNLRREEGLSIQLAKTILQTYSKDPDPLNCELVGLLQGRGDTRLTAAKLSTLSKNYLLNETFLDSLRGSFLPNLLPSDALTSIKIWYEQMITSGNIYGDFDDRVGISWTDYRTELSNGQVVLHSEDPVKKCVGGKEQHPQSVFRYPAISSILLSKILPQYMSIVSEFHELPPILYWQTFFLRSNLVENFSGDNKLVSWHQDPSEYKAVADFTMVVMLDDPQDHNLGWSGGELLVKNGMPNSRGRCLRLTPAFNQAIVFRNDENSHAVTKVYPQNVPSTRDIIVVNLYLNDPSKS